ncbi:MAG: vanadium-dependent haloperoxidase [Saprospiraceae bacterium]|nr:vanadium-dependent haloperoxidase [Saprospiraceae bacterium]
MHILSNKKSIIAISIAGALLAILAWRGVFSVKNIAKKQEPAVALMLDWYKYALVAERFSEGYRPPVVARVYAYMGLAGWEAARPVIGGGFQSLAPRYPELKLPLPEPAARYHLPTVLNACYSNYLQKMFMTAPRSVEQERNELEAKWAATALKSIDSTTFLASAEFGKKIALAVYNWSATDSIGHQGNLHLYDKNYTPPAGTSYWQPCEDFPMPPMLPHWGEARTFVIKTEDHLAAPLPPFSMEPQSPYYVQALEVFTMNSPLSPENQWIAEFWSDDFPGLTYSSAGRWISISNQVIEQERPNVEKALETYLRVGLALSDAAVACWHSKYHYNLLRPETFIRHTIQPDWRPIVHTPSFPAYPSGHAMFSAAAAEVLTQLYGKKYELTDRSHEGRTEFKGTPRHFHSFYEMAFENASSRIALGVHYRMDCDEGTRLGLNIGKEIAAVPVAKLEQ